MNNTGSPMTGVKEHIRYDNKTGKAKTVCSSHVLAYLGIPPSAYHYSNRLENIAGVLRRVGGFAVRSRDSACKTKKRPSVGAIRKVIKSGKMNDPKGTHYAVLVDYHILLLDGNGKTVVDTDPRKADRRKAWAVRAIF